MKMWGGRFSSPPNQDMWEFTVDHADRRLLPFDIEGSIAHVEMLAKVGLLEADEGSTLEKGLQAIAEEAATGSFGFLDTDEDVHSAVERRLVELVGDIGGKLHTGRSRNDQIALDLRLYLRSAALSRRHDLAALITALADQAARHQQTAIATYTHLQQAQRSTLGHHLLAHAWALQRDQGRLADLGKRLSVSPLGAGASAGSSLPLDPMQTALRLGFEASFENSLDAVSSRDLVAEFGFAVTQTMVNLSRLAEELVIWASLEFGWVEMADEFTTGSSALPQKKNPDVAELVRGRAAGAIGHLSALLALQKGLPLSYNRDLQEDKPALFWLDDTMGASSRALTQLIATATFSPPPPSPWTDALGIAENLVRRGIAFRTAHQIVGGLVARLLADGRTPAEIQPEDLAATGLEASDLEVRPSQAGLSVPEQIARLRQSLA
ncbi:MAG TPA: argininosuccinate lyase [Acidimicrobiia bacterium]|nr:argininosuccinate lyase [Acidimicrobiia bacterium]